MDGSREWRKVKRRDYSATLNPDGIGEINFNVRWGDVRVMEGGKKKEYYKY